MQNILTIIKYLIDVDKDATKAGIVASSILAGALVICAMALIFKKILLNRKYREDEEYVKAYKKKMKEREESSNTDKKPTELTEDF